MGRGVHCLIGTLRESNFFSTAYLGFGMAGSLLLPDRLLLLFDSGAECALLLLLLVPTAPPSTRGVRLIAPPFSKASLKIIFT